MTEKSSDNDSAQRPMEGTVLAGTLSKVGWSLFLIWLGIVLLVKFSMGVVLLGVGGIILGMQATRKYVGLELEKPWVGVGLVFALGGVWDLLELKLPLIPLVLVAAGIVILVSTLRNKSEPEE